MALFGHESANHGHQHGYQAEDSSGYGVLVLLGTAYPGSQGTEREEGDEAHGIRAYHTESGELVFLVIIGGHHVKERTVGHIDHRVTCHHQQVERIGPDAFAYRTQFGGEEQERKDDAEGYRTEDEPRAIGAPAGLGTVRNGPHKGVGDDIEHTGDEHQRRCVRESQTEDVGEEHREGDGHNLPGDTAGSGITQSICDFFS